MSPRTPARRILGAALLAGSLVASIPAQPGPEATAALASPLTNVQAILELPEEIARRGHPVRLEGLTLYHDTATAFLVLRDATGGIVIQTAGGQLALARGQAVAVEGLTGVFGTNRIVRRAALQVRPQHHAVPAEPATAEDLISGRGNFRYLEFEGMVGSASELQGSTRLHIHSGNDYFDAILRGVKPDSALATGYLDARIRLRGVVLPFRKPIAESKRPLLVVSGPEDIIIESPGHLGLVDLPATDIAQVPAITTDCRIRVVGRLAARETNDWLRVEDTTGTLRVRVDRPVNARPGDHVEVLGFPLADRGEPTLDHALVRLVAPAFQAPADGTPRPPAPLRPLLQSIEEIIQLPTEQAGLGYPVRVRGTVTFHDAPWHMLFLRDTGNGVFVWPARGQEAVLRTVHPGQILEVQGYTSPGEFLPTVIDGRITPLAEGKLPVPRELPYDALASGQHDCQWVGLEGVVRAVRVENSHLFLDVSTTGGRFTAMVSGFTNSSPPHHLVDAAVHLRGVCSIIPNPRRQAVGFRLFVPRPVDITVRRAAPEDPFDLRTRTAASLFRYNPQEATGHRVKLRGVVTLQRRPDTFFLRDATGGLFVQLRGQDSVRPGDVVEVVGFPAVLASSARLEDADFRVVGRTNAPAPKPITPVQALNGFHDGEWVSLEARLLEVLPRSELPTLMLAAGRTVFEAVYVRTNRLDAFAHLRPGSLLRVPGICTVKMDEGGVPRSFSLQGGSPADVQVLLAAPWWTPRHALILGGSLLALGLGALAWGVLLRRQVRRQTQLIRDLNTGLERRVAERTAELEAANRELESFSYSVSHDLRAPLRAVNGFAEVLLQTHGPNLDEKGHRYLRHVAEGGRRMGRLVDDLLTFSRLGRQPLASAPLDLNQMVAEAVQDVRRPDPGRQVEVHLDPLPPARGDRALIQQVLVNLIGNAWKFTGNQPHPRIHIGCLAPKPGEAGPVYFVQDNGAGFDMRYADKLFGVFQRLHRDDEYPGTGVGLAIVQRILHRHGGRIWAESRPGAGATFFFTLPAADREPEPCTAFGK